jgi:STE24 endopeptidase
MWRLLALCLLLITSATEAAPAALVIPQAAQASDHFDPVTATNAWLATVSPAQKRRSDSYFEGGYWLKLWDFLVSSFAMILLLETTLSARMRDWTKRLTRFLFLRSYIYWIEFVIATVLLTSPLTIYEGFFRERQYGLSNQSFEGWLSDQLIGLALLLALGGFVFAVLALIVKRLARTWHIWGALAAFLFIAIGVLIEPVFIDPLFNAYKPLQNPAIKNQILGLAHANGIPAKDVYEVDASKQSKRVSAFVSGFGDTERIVLNDNLLNRCSPQAIMATMGHEMGHYVLHHVYNGLIFFAFVMLLMFRVLRWAMETALVYWGVRWQVRETSDVAALPLGVLVLTTLGFFFMPINNTFTRAQEFEADVFGLNAARQPDGEAEVDLLLGEYRKLDPSPLEEFLFYDHPGGRTRIYAAMRWKAENLCLFNARLPCGIPPDSILQLVPSGATRPHARSPQ